MLWCAGLGLALPFHVAAPGPCAELGKRLKEGLNPFCTCWGVRAETSSPRALNKHISALLGEAFPGFCKPMNSIVGGSSMWSGRRGLCISMGSDRVSPPPQLHAQHSSSLFASAGGGGVDFQGLLALLCDFPDSHVNLGQAVCSFECGNIVC